ncbi:MAG: phosphoheptose isomerase, partial [Nanoarchaeota archaeon]
KEKGLSSIGLLGKAGGELKKYCDLPIVVPSNSAPRIQEAHLLIMHSICEIVEKDLFDRKY